MFFVVRLKQQFYYVLFVFISSPNFWCQHHKMGSLFLFFTPLSIVPLWIKCNLIWRWEKATNLFYCSSLLQVIGHTNKSPASWITSLKVLIQFTIAWLSSCHCSTLRSTALMVDNVFVNFVRFLQTPQTKPIAWIAKDPN